MSIHVPAHQAADVIRTLLPHLRADRFARMQSVLNRRRDSMRLVFENVSDAGNINAALRTSEARGFQHFHVVESINNYHGGAGDLDYSRWLTMHRHKTAAEAVSELKAEGFTVLATTLSPTAVDVARLDLTGRKVALICGNENRGVSSAAAAAADAHVVLPMLGFTQSLNVSVCAATLTARMDACTPQMPYTTPAPGDAARLADLRLPSGQLLHPDWMMPAPVLPAPVTGPLVVADAPLPPPALHPAPLGPEERMATLARWMLQSNWDCALHLKAAGIVIEGV